MKALKALRVRDFACFFTGQVVSSLGNALQAVALAWMVVSIHGSATDLAVTLLALTLPQATLTLLGGVFVDRFDARSMMIRADSIRLITASALALVAGDAGAHLWLIWVILLVHGTGNAFFAPAATSLAPRLVEQDAFESANALATAVAHVGPLLGFLVAGPLVTTVGPTWAFWLNAGSYGIAIFMALLMHPMPRIPREHPQQSRVLWRDLGDAVHYLRTVPWLLGFFLMDMLVALAGISTNSVGVPLLAKAMQTGALGYSILAWSYSAGTVLGLLVPAFFPIRAHRGLLCIASKLAEALFLTATAFVPLPVATVCMAGWSTLNGILVVVSLSLIQQKTPTSMLGRMTAFSMLSSMIMLPVAQGFGGLLASAIGAQALFVVAGCSVLLSGIVGWCIPAIRVLD